MEYEKRKGRKPVDVSDKKLGYEIESSGRVIEVKVRDFPKGYLFVLHKENLRVFPRGRTVGFISSHQKERLLKLAETKFLKATKPKIDCKSQEDIG